MTAPESEFKKKLIWDIIELRGALWSRVAKAALSNRATRILLSVRGDLSEWSVRHTTTYVLFK